MSTFLRPVSVFTLRSSFDRQNWSLKWRNKQEKERILSDVIAALDGELNNEKEKYTLKQ